MTMRASLIITGKDQGASSMFTRLANAAKRTVAAFKPVGQEARAASREIDRVGAGGAVARFARIGAAARKLAGDMRIAERAAYGTGRAIGWTIRKGAGMAWGAAKWGAGAAVAGGVGLMAGVISTAAKFEQFQAQLEGTEGSAKKAADAMNWVAKFAAQTPYQVDEVTDALVRARGVGIDPFNGAMREMGDAASANRKTLMDAVEAIADAQTGEFERLKAFNITTSVKGGAVSFAFLDKDGKNAVRTTKKNAADIQRTILGIWDARHGGAMIRQSKTFAGIWANLQDAVTMFMLKISQKGIFETIKKDLAAVLDWVNRLADDGTLDQWAQKISDNLKLAWEWASKLIKNTDWATFGEELSGIASAAWKTALAFAKIVEWGSAVPWLGDKLINDQLIQTRREKEKSPAEKEKAEASDPWWRVISLRHDAPVKPKPKVPPKALPHPGATGKPTAQNVNMRGDIRVEVATAPGTQARVTRLQSDDKRVAVRAKTGKAMADAA